MAIDTEVEDLARLMGISPRQLDHLTQAIIGRQLALFCDDPLESARWIVRELGLFQGSNLYDALKEALCEAATDNDAADAPKSAPNKARGSFH
jgi:hypothetical protein